MRTSLKKDNSKELFMVWLKFESAYTELMLSEVQLSHL